MKSIFSSIIIFLIYITINAQTKFEAYKVGHEFSVSVPEYMTKTKELNSNASIQFMNALKEAYTIVLDESKDDHKLAGIKFNIDDYYDDLMTNFVKGLTNVDIGEPMKFKEKGFNYKQVQMYATSDKVNISYLITCIETEKYFYRIICWTVKENKSKLINDFIKISTSLRERN